MNALAYLLLIASASLAAFTPTFSQNYRLSPGNSLQLTGLMEDQQTLIISQVNTSKTSITFRWKKLSATVPEKWESSICDNLICYTSLVDSGTMSPLLPGDSSYILLHITPHVTYGDAVIRYMVWDSTTPATIDTLTFTLVVSPNSVSEYTANMDTVVLFPNPAHNTISISTASESEFAYTIEDITGKVRTSGFSSTPFTLDTQNYPTGLYLVRITTDKKHSTYQFIKL